MTDEGNVYSYTADQAQVIRLYDTYRNCLLKVKYYGHRLQTYKRLNVVMDIATALAASSAFTGQALMKTGWGINTVSALLLTSAVITVVRPILKIGDGINLYSKLYSAFGELFYRIESLNDDIRDEEALTQLHKRKGKDIVERYRALELQTESVESARAMARYQEEVDKAIPADRLWLPPADANDKVKASAATASQKG